MRLFKKFIKWFLLGGFLLGLTSFFVARLAIDNADLNLANMGKFNVELASQSLREALSQPASHLRSLAVHEESLKRALDREGPIDLSAIEQAFQSLLLRNPSYAQIRLIGNDGFERVRVERLLGDTVQSVPEAELQNKADRPYVPKGRALGFDEIYISPLDLNIEKGEVEIPYKPTIRMIMQVFKQNGQAVGLLVLNISVAQTLQQFTRYAHQQDLMLLNDAGYWLKSTTAEDEWGFMFGRASAFVERYPAAWRAIKGLDAGQIETAAGFWSWQTVHVDVEKPKISHNISLKTVSSVRAEAVNKIRWLAVRQIVYISIVAFFIFAIGLYRLLAAIEARQRVEQAERDANLAKSNFLAVMSHEIRTPMTGVLGFVDMLLEDPLPLESKNKAIQIKEVSLSLLVIINDILDISKLDAGKFEIEAVIFKPARIIHDVVQLFSQTCPADKKGRLNIKEHVGEDVPDFLQADPTRLRQVLINLMGNAVKFTAQGSIILQCRLGQTQPGERPYLIFEVSDTGIGIDEGAKGKLFEAFVQADATISRKYQGTGLGLAVCKRLVELMGGKIGVESRLGEGSCFWFHFPFETVDAVNSIDDKKDIVSDGTIAISPLSILVAEDNEINQLIICSFLNKMGHKLTLANNGIEAIDRIKSEDFDVVLMDIRMPVMSGLDAAQKIRQLAGSKGQIPIIALTADVMEDNQASYLAAGMNACVAKPIDRQLLLQAIARVVA